MTILTMSFLQICRKLSLLYLARYPLGTISTYRSLAFVFRCVQVHARATNLEFGQGQGGRIASLGFTGRSKEDGT